MVWGDGVRNLLAIAAQRGRFVREAESKLLRQECFKAIERIRIVSDFLSAELLKLAVHIVRVKRNMSRCNPPVPLAGLLQPPLDGSFVISNFRHVVHS